MSLSIVHIGLFVFVALAAGLAVGWLASRAHNRRQAEQITDKWQIKYDDAARQRDRLGAENTKIRTSIEAQQAVLHKHELAASKYRTELESVVEKAKSLSKDLFACRAERDDLQRKFAERQDELASARRQVTDLENEFEKAGVFYKAELEKSFEKRKLLDARLDDAKAEHASLSNLLQATQHEKNSINKMLMAAQARLDNLDALEQKAIALEAENAQLRHDASGVRQEIEVLQRDVAELEALKVQNKELAHCLKSMESSRRQYEEDAQRYRDKADRSEQRSETLRMRLDDVEKSFSDMARQHDEALRMVGEVPPAPKPNGNGAAEPEQDDLTEIVGIGKVFEKTLHELGVYSFRQIASFGPGDIARVNMALKEFRGRMEQDDWVGQAKELFFRKYGDEA